MGTEQELLETIDLFIEKLKEHNKANTQQVGFGKLLKDKRMKAYLLPDFRIEWPMWVMHGGGSLQLVDAFKLESQISDLRKRLLFEIDGQTSALNK